MEKRHLLEQYIQCNNFWGGGAVTNKAKQNLNLPRQIFQINYPKSLQSSFSHSLYQDAVDIPSGIFFHQKMVYIDQVAYEKKKHADWEDSFVIRERKRGKKTQDYHPSKKNQFISFV